MSAKYDEYDVVLGWQLDTLKKMTYSQFYGDRMQPPVGGDGPGVVRAFSVGGVRERNRESGTK
jgi:hypothetical protein